MWREQQGVREALGWAIEPERQERSVLHVFDNGYMVWLQNSDVVYVFFYNGGIATAGQRLR